MARFDISYSRVSGFIVSNSKIKINCVKCDEVVESHPGIVTVAPARKVKVNVKVSKVRSPFVISNRDISSPQDRDVFLNLNLCLTSFEKDAPLELVKAWPVLRPIPATFFSNFNHQQIFASAVDMQLLKV